LHKQIIDFEPLLHGEIYGPLRDLNLLSQAYRDPELKTLIWLSGPNFDLYVLHKWPRLGEQLAQRVR
jgi:hypothetical protein